MEKFLDRRQTLDGSRFGFGELEGGCGGVS